MSRPVHRSSDVARAEVVALLGQMARHLTDDRLKAVERVDGKASLAHADVPIRLDWSLAGGPVHATVGHEPMARRLQIRDWRPGSVDESRTEALRLATDILAHLSSSDLIDTDPVELAPVVADVATRVEAARFLVILATPWGAPERIRRRDRGSPKWSADLRRIDRPVTALLPVSVSASISQDTDVVSIFPTELEADAPGPVEKLRLLAELATMRNDA